MREPFFQRVLKGLEEAKTHAKVNLNFHEMNDTPDTIDKQNESPEDEPMKHKAKKELITRQVEDTNLATKKDKSHYLNELEVGWRKMKAKAAESPDDIVEDSIEMAMANLKSLTMHLQSLIVMVQAGNQECLAEPWVQEKLTLSRDYIMAVHDYISSEQEGENDKEEDNAEEENNYYGQSSKNKNGKGE